MLANLMGDNYEEDRFRCDLGVRLGRLRGSDGARLDGTVAIGPDIRVRDIFDRDPETIGKAFDSTDTCSRCGSRLRQ